MNLEGIISVSGKPGLFKVLSKKKNGLVVESLADGKKLNIFALDKVSALDDISIYTYEADIPLKEVYKTLFELEKGKETINHKEDAEVLREKMLLLLPDFDQDRVYISDLKKLFQWYNLLVSAGLLKVEEPKEEKKEVKAKKVEKAVEGEKSKKETTAKKKTVKKPAAKTKK